MAFPLKDVRFTVRRQAGGLPLLYPRLLRDSALLPKIDMAVRYFESLVGRERADLDAETLVQFFGDPKLARCVIAALSRTYRYRARRFDELMRPAAVRRLIDAGITAPKLLRLALYDHVNAADGGFVEELARPTAYAALATKLHVRPADVEQGLFLDAPERAVLTRTGRPAKAPDVVAQCNFGLLEALLRHAEYVELGAGKQVPGLQHAVAALAEEFGIEADMVGAGTLSVAGRQDALGNWSRHGRKVARFLVTLVVQARYAFQTGTAAIALPGRRAILRMTDETLDVLAGRMPTDPSWIDDRVARKELLETLVCEIRQSAVGQSAVGVTIRRSPDPQAWEAGVLVPDLEVRAGSWRVFIRAVCSATEGERLGSLGAALAGEAVRFVGREDAIDALRARGAPVLSLDDFRVNELLAA